MVKQIKIIHNNSYDRFEDIINDFLKSHPDGQILGAHPKSLADGSGFVAIVTYSKDMKPYQELLGEAKISNEKIVNLQSILKETQDRAAQYQTDSVEANKKLRNALDENKALKTALENANPTENKLEEFIFSEENIKDEWIISYEEKTGQKAFWKGEYTKGFKRYVESEELLNS